MDFLMINQTSKWLIYQLNSLPHLNMWFTYSNTTTFDPYNPDYLETILFWTTIPILFLIFLLLLLIIYACCLVCNNATQPLIRQKTNLKQNLCKYKCSIVFFIILLSTSLGLCVFGSETFHYSFKKLTTNLDKFSQQFNNISNQTKLVKEKIEIDLQDSLNKIDLVIQQQTSSSNQLIKIKNEIKSIRLTLNQSLLTLNSLDQVIHENNAYKSVISDLNSIENTRWLIMVSIVSVNMFLILILTIGLIGNSKGSLCFFAFAGVLILISIWILNAIYLGISVFISDYCINPNEYTLKISDYNLNKRLLIQYYTQCPHQQQQIPFQHELYKTQSKLNTAQTMFNDNLSEMTKSIINVHQVIQSSNFTKILDITNRHLNKISTMISCDHTSVYYSNIIHELCTNSIFGLSLVLIGGLLFGIILPFLICVIPQLWKRLDSMSTSPTTTTTNSDEAHPFIPMNASNQRSIARTYNESPTFHRLGHSSDENPYTLKQNGTISQSYYIRSNGTIQRGTLQRGTLTGV